MRYQFAIDNAEHLIALGNTTVHINDDDKGFPWAKVDALEQGGTYRLNMPSSFYAIVHEADLVLKCHVDFESADANGRGISMFDREKLRGIIMRLPSPARGIFSRLLAEEVLPSIEERSAEIRKTLSAHLDSEDCVRGLIAFAAAAP